MFTKLFQLYPLSATQDPKGTMLSYIDETRDIPALWLSHALSMLTREPERRFSPSVGEIRGAALKSIRAKRRKSEGKPEKMIGMSGDDPIRPERELAWALENQRLMIGSGK